MLEKIKINFVSHQLEMSIASQDQLSIQQLSDDRLSALAEETMMTPGESIIMTEKGASLYERFCIARAINRKYEDEEDEKIRNIFLKIGKEQAEKAVANEQNELYNKEDEEHLIRKNTHNNKTGLEEAFEEMVMVKNAYDEVMSDMKVTSENKLTK